MEVSVLCSWAELTIRPARQWRLIMNLLMGFWYVSRSKWKLLSAGIISSVFKAVSKSIENYNSNLTLFVWIYLFDEVTGDDIKEDLDTVRSKMFSQCGSQKRTKTPLRCKTKNWLQNLYFAGIELQNIWCPTSHQHPTPRLQLAESDYKLQITTQILLRGWCSV